MTNKNKIDDYLKMSIIGGMIIIALSFAYYFVIFIPQRENKKLEIQQSEIYNKQQQEFNKNKDLKDCLNTADINKNEYWNKTCQDYGVDRSGGVYRKDNCNLDKYHSDAVDAYLKNEQEKCYQLYK